MGSEAATKLCRTFVLYVIYRIFPNAIFVNIVDKLKEIASKFDVEGIPDCVTPFGSGLINDTYRVTCVPVDGVGAPCPEYVLQRINHNIFRDVELLQRNIARITGHIRTRLAERGEGDIERKALRLVPVLGGDGAPVPAPARKLFYFDGEAYWRMTVLISGAKTHEQLTPELACHTGRAFGDFQGMLADLPADPELPAEPNFPGGAPLGATIPDFHNMEFRLGQLRDAIAGDKAGRVAEMQGMIDEIASRAGEMCLAERMNRAGTLPKRISHCDTKVNNVLFDERTGEVLCVIDLDTTMPGYAMADFGDFIRTAGNTGAEDDRDPGRVGLDMEIFEAFARGYLETAGKFLTPTEIDLLPFGAKMLTYMQAVRFLTDYLNGDTYYKIASPDHNRVRTLAQFAHLRSLEGHEAEMKRYIETIKSQL
uniref:Putative phosphotransferase n=1 Tax=termite gut metagenome TaxID=433724 RepID=S0DDG8_9ZZZZ